MYVITHQRRAVLLHRKLRKLASDMICRGRYGAQVRDKGYALYAPHLSACEQLVRVKTIVGCNAMHCCKIGAFVPGYTVHKVCSKKRPNFYYKDFIAHFTAF
jgi:cystathionine beta-lyase family protein involved in aluminum resistance